TSPGGARPLPSSRGAPSATGVAGVPGRGSTPRTTTGRRRAGRFPVACPTTFRHTRPLPAAAHKSPYADNPGRMPKSWERMRKTVRDDAAGGRLQFAAAFERARQRDVVGVVQIAAFGETAGDPRDADAERFEQARD